MTKLKIFHKEYMMKELLLAYDLGTTGAKVVIFNKDAKMLGSKYHQYETYYPKINWVEQAPEEWWRAVVECTKELVIQTEINPKDIAAISFSGQMMCAIPINKNGDLLMKRVPIWADARSTDQVKKVFEIIGGYKEFYRITMQGHNPELYSIFKAMWIKENLSSVYKETHKFLHAKEYIALKMTGKFLTDYSDQGLGGTLDMRKHTWSDEMLKASGIGQDKFPELHNSIDLVGHLTKKASKQLNLVEGIPVVLGAGDGPCAATGAGAMIPGDAYFYIGSASWGGAVYEKPVGDFDTKIIVEPHAAPNLSTSIYVLYTGGIAQQWAVNVLFSKPEKNVDYYEYLSKLAAKVPREEDTLIFLPFMRPGGAPYNNLNARGVFIGLGLHHRPEHLYKAVLEGVCFSIKLLLDRFEKMSGKKLPSFNIIGGGTKNPYWMQLLSDITKRGIQTPKLKQEANCLGAAIIGAIGVGLINDFTEAKKLIEPEKTYFPNLDHAYYHDKKYEAFLFIYKDLLKSFDLIADLEKDFAKNNLKKRNHG